MVDGLCEDDNLLFLKSCLHKTTLTHFERSSKGDIIWEMFLVIKQENILWKH